MQLGWDCEIVRLSFSWDTFSFEILIWDIMVLSGSLGNDIDIDYFLGHKILTFGLGASFVLEKNKLWRYIHTKKERKYMSM